MDIKMDKKATRVEILAKRYALSDYTLQNKSLQIMDKVIVTSKFKEAEIILTYVSYGSEVNTIPFINYCFKQNKIVAVPKINPDNNKMDFYMISSTDDLEIGFHKILEPKADRIIPEYLVVPKNVQSCLMILPGVAFDIDFHRIGYGGGYYDRYLEKTSDFIYKMAVAFQIQLKKAIPYDALDVTLDSIITEYNVLIKEGTL